MLTSRKRQLRSTRALFALLLLALSCSALAAVGRTHGEFDVSSSGASGYSIPLSLPPGAHGLTPTLALQYDQRGGNGLLGMGWSIGGLSVISLCNKTWVQDGAPAPASAGGGDRYCLDGAQLRLTSGTYGTAGSTYQTEIESFAKVTAVGSAGAGPQSFTVHHKSGLIYEYGNTTNSRIEITGTTVRIWALNKIKDRSGNYIDFTYHDDTTNGSYRPNEILYTGNSTTGASATHRLLFVYETRPAADTLVSYFAGGRMKEVNRIDRIELQHMSGSWQRIRKYDLAYTTGSASSRSQLTSIQECAASDAQCLSPTTIAYQSGSQGLGATRRRESIREADRRAERRQAALPTDFFWPTVCFGGPYTSMPKSNSSMRRSGAPSRATRPVARGAMADARTMQRILAAK